MEYYKEKAKKIIREEGWGILLKKAYEHTVVPVRQKIDQWATKLLARWYVRGFHKLFYYTFLTDMAGRNKEIYWMGIPTSKCPMDMWIYQEMLWELKPDIIIETGTDRGGSALFFASLCEVIGHGQVVTIDVTEYSTNVVHPRITKIVGSSVSEEVLEKVRTLSKGKRVMVVLDSDHKKNHVLEEMRRYGGLVSVGGYMVVEDTNINGHPVLPGWGEGPTEAVEAFLREKSDFVRDNAREKFMLTFYPKGFLKKVR